MFLFSKKPEYCNIMLITKNRGNVKLSLVKGKPIREALEQFNTHIIDKKEHILKVYKHDIQHNSIEYDIETPIMNNIVLYSY